MRKQFALLLAVLASSGTASAQKKCTAAIYGYQIKTVYVTGDQYNAVVWAYKHLSEETCMTPVTDASKADAILETINTNRKPTGQSPNEPLTVTCSSSAGSSTCIDSNGNEMDIACDSRGNCSSYFGPSPGMAVVNALNNWISNAWYQAEVNLYTPDHKLIWTSVGQKGAAWHDLWPDKLREATGSPVCPRNAFSAHRYKNYRQWASERCGVVFDPLVSIDIKAIARRSAKEASANQMQAAADEMKHNAEKAAAKQKPNN